MLEGPLAALDAIEQATGERKINTIGYCLGGTLLGATLGYMAAKGDDRVNSATFFVALLDFSIPGELGVFIDEQQVESLERRMNERGFLEGSEMAGTFSMLRSNDLVWSFVINNYLMGKEPFPFDLLYWNSDSTRMPAKMHSFYLRNMYLKNALKDPGGVHARRGADRPRARCGRRRTSSRPSRTTSRRGSRPTSARKRPRRPGALRARRLRPHRRDRQPAGGEEVLLLD